MARDKAQQNAYHAANLDKINAQRRERYAANSEKHLEQNRRWREANRDKVNARRRKSTYGTDGSDLWEEQDGLCATCRTPLALLPSKHRHIDHCHTSGVVRGLLCNQCNLALGYIRGGPEVLRNMADYLEKFEMFK